jgi:large subunit ribosomal protein L1
MSRNGKRYEAARKLIEESREYPPTEAIGLIKRLPEAKFDETVEVAFRLGVDPRKADQIVRGTVSLPHGTGRTVRVAVFAQGPKATEAREAGADVVGAEELVDQVMKGTIDFDAAIATPDMMSSVGKAGRVLGPRGLMPNPKTGTVTTDIAKAVAEIKGGRIEYKTDRTGNVHMVIGKKSFGERQLLDNYLTAVDEILRAKPSAAKGKYVKSLTISTTMGPGIPIDPNHMKDVETTAAPVA